MDSNWNIRRTWGIILEIWWWFGRRGSGSEVVGGGGKRGKGRKCVLLKENCIFEETKFVIL